MFSSLGRKLMRKEMSVASSALASSQLTAAPKYAINSEATYASSISASTGKATPFSTKPLRVVRVVETGQARSSVGRMVISGSMADVCAELERLAAREAALT